MDSLEEALASVTKVPDPPLYVQYNSKLLNDWHKWALHYEEPQEGGKIRPLGQKVGPSWMRWGEDFKGLEDFFQYYKDLLEEE